MVEEPDLDSAVFCRVVRELREGEELVVKGTDARVELSRGDVVVVRYRAVRKWVLGGEVELI